MSIEKKLVRYQGRYWYYYPNKPLDWMGKTELVDVKDSSLGILVDPILFDVEDKP